MADRSRWGRLRWWTLGLTMGAALAVFGGAPSSATVTLPPVGWSSGPSLPAPFGPRWDYSVAYYPPTDQVVVFGGAPDTTGSWKNDTWLYTVTPDRWTQGPVAPAGLKPRSGASMAYDPALGKLVLYGGAGTTWPPYGDTWLFDGTAWTQGPTGPQGRVGARMVYDDLIGKLVMFSGSGVKPFVGTWLFDGTTWTQGQVPPGGLHARVFYAMAYDPTVGKVFVAGGDRAVDSWYFDGTIWTKGPDLPPDIGPQERLQAVYDPQLGGIVLYGGIGPTGAHGDGWIFRPADGSWTYIGVGDFKPGALLEASLVWVPTKDAFMLVGGESDDNDGTPVLDTYFFRDVAPYQSSVSIAPSNPDMTMKVTMSGGGRIGGYGMTDTEMQWFINGQPVPGGTEKTLWPQYRPGDQLQAKIRMHDALNVYGPWVASPVVTVVDRPPHLRDVAITPSSPTTTDTLVSSASADDPDGDQLTYTYAWTANGGHVGGNTSTLSPDLFEAGDVVGLTITVADGHGQQASLPAPDVTIVYNITANPGNPGGAPTIKGKGFGPTEQVDVRIDSPSGPPLATYTTDASGSWPYQGLQLPGHVAGGTHILYGTGRTSGKLGEGPILILPVASISPTKFGKGETVNFTGDGWSPGESVSVSFPGQPPSVVVAGSDGSANLNLVAPPEPNPGGDLTVTAPSGAVAVAFKVAQRMTVPATGAPGATVNVTVTGYGANETVRFNEDSAPPVVTGRTSAVGSLTVAMPLSGFFGNHSISASGDASGLSSKKNIKLPATMTVSPSSGPRGTVVTISSGPGWQPNSSLRFKVGSRTLTPKTTDANGSVTFTYTISTKDPLGSLAISLYSSTLKKTAWGTFTVMGELEE